MNDRQSRLLQAIIDEFISTAIPIGSKQIVEHGLFDVSGATIRNEMQTLSEEGFIEQPHISAGRIPTAKGYRIYVREFLKPIQYETVVRKKFEGLKDQYCKQKDQERVYEAVTLLTRMTPNIVFATVPHKEHVFYLGLGNVLKQPELLADPHMATGIVEVLEDHLTEILCEMDLDEQVQTYIGEENVLPQIRSCSMLVSAYEMGKQHGAIGILGPMRMDYGYNTVALELIADMIRSV